MNLEEAPSIRFLTLQVFGQCGGASMRMKFWQNYFLGRNFPFASLFVFGEIRAIKN